MRSDENTVEWRRSEGRAHRRSSPERGRSRERKKVVKVEVRSRREKDRRSIYWRGVMKTKEKRGVLDKYRD